VGSTTLKKGGNVVYTARIKFKREADIRYISHLDMQRMVQRILRRAEVPMKYSEGFNPHPKLAFAMAMGVGLTSDCEYVDVELMESIDPVLLVGSMNESAPKGFTALKAIVTEEKLPSLTSLIEESVYQVTCLLNASGEVERLYDQLKSILESESIVYRKRNKKGKWSDKEIRPLIKELSANTEGLKVNIIARLATGSKENLRPEVVLDKIDPEKSLFDQEHGCVYHRLFLGKVNGEELI
jgi:radical SAM-linked protein